MKTLRLSSPPWWWVLFGASVPLFEAARQSKGVGPGMTVSPTVDGIDVFLCAFAAVIVWFGASFARRMLYDIGKWIGGMRKKKAPVLTDVVRPKQSSVRQSTADPGQLVASWIAAKAVRREGALTNILLARASFEAYCRKEQVEPSSNKQWLPRRLRELGFPVESRAKVKGDKAVGNRYIEGLMLK